MRSKSYVPLRKSLPNVGHLSMSYWSKEPQMSPEQYRLLSLTLVSHGNYLVRSNRRHNTLVSRHRQYHTSQETFFLLGRFHSARRCYIEEKIHQWTYQVLQSQSARQNVPNIIIVTWLPWINNYFLIKYEDYTTGWNPWLVC